MNDVNPPTQGARQLQALALLDQAATSYGDTMLAIGGGGCLLALSCPGSMLLGSALDGPDASGFVHRLAGVPVWVVILMTLLGLFFAVLGLFLGLKMRRQGSHALAHLRAHPDDPFVGVSYEVVVRNGNRVVHVHLATQSGAAVHEVVLHTWEDRVRAAIDEALSAS